MPSPPGRFKQAKQIAEAFNGTQRVLRIIFRGRPPLVRTRRTLKISCKHGALAKSDPTVNCTYEKMPMVRSHACLWFNSAQPVASSRLVRAELERHALCHK